MEPVFSVIIPLYNKEKYIQKAIESVLNQTFEHFELLVIDDGSKDGSLTLVRQYSDPRLKIIAQENAGVSKARNNAVALAQSELIAFLDADDWWEVDFLEKMQQLITDFPEAAVYSSSYFKVKHGENIPANIGVSANFKSGYIPYYEVYSKTFWVPVNCSFVVVKKEAFLKEKGFNPALKFGEDFDLWLRLSLHHKFAFLNEKLAFSNQDVEVANRALGEKTWKKEEHVLFNLAYLKQTEQENEKLHYLLDGLRLRSLQVYHRAKIYKKEVDQIISGIDFKNHAKIYYFYYKFPFWIVEPYLFYKKCGSRMKKLLKRIR